MVEIFIMDQNKQGDKLFVKKLTVIVNSNISREDFDVEELAREAGMSRSSIHRKLKEITNQNASQFIREIRLKKAMEMLQLGIGTASEIAFKVGFGSPAYFTKCFHEFFGFPPGEVKKRKDSIIPDEEPQETDQTEGTNRLQEKETAVVVYKQKLKRILVPVSVIIMLVIVTVILLFITGNFNGTSKDNSIVVLPFKNLSNDPGNQYFADGIMEDILNNLCHVSNLRVISRTTSEYFRSKDMTSGEIADLVNARNVLEGSIRRDGDKVRVSVQLINANRDEHLWSENYDRNVTDLMGVQGEIAKEIAGRLKTVLSDSELQKLKETPTRSPEAYDYYLQARFLLHKANSNQRYDISKEGLMSSLQYYEKAIAADSNFAEAYAGLANAWFNLSAWGWYKPYLEGIDNAKHYCSLALEKDPDCAEAHAVKGVFLIFPDHNFEEARKELQISIKNDPNFSTARQWYAQLLMITGPIEEARRQVNRAVELEPYFWVVQNLNSWIYYFEEKYDKGLEACSTARDLNPASPDNIWLFVLHNAQLGNAEKVVDELKVIFKYFPAATGYEDEVIKACNEGGVEGIFRWLIDVNMNKPLPVEGLNGHPFYISWWYAIIGDRENSMLWLDKTIDAKPYPAHYFYLITTNPDFDILRGDPRFTSLIEKIGLSAYNTRPAR